MTLADGAADIMECGEAGFSDAGDPDDVSIRIVADIDLVKDCTTLAELYEPLSARGGSGGTATGCAARERRTEGGFAE